MTNDRLQYTYRPDGNFLIRRICRDCGEGFDVHALQNVTMEYFYDLCPACEFVRKATKESEPK